MAQILLPNGKPHVSFSEVSCWVQCSWRHKLQHILKLGANKPSIHLFFGTACHESVQALIKSGVASTEAARKYLVEELMKHPDDEELAKVDIDKTVKSIQNILDDVPAFFDENFPKWELVSIEEPLYEDMKQFFESHEGVSFKGFIDVILKIPGKKEGDFTYWIIDLKTASRPWGLDKIKDQTVRSQLIFYKKFWAVKHNIPLNKIKCGFVTMLKSGKPGKLLKLIPISVGEKSVEKTLHVLNSSLSSIKRGIALKNRASCKWCEFKGTENCT